MEKNRLDELLRDEILYYNTKSKQEIVNLVGNDLLDFIRNFNSVMEECKGLNATIKLKEDYRGNYIATYVYSSLNNLISSVSLLMAGHLISAGNLIRIFMEAIIIALLFSANNLDIDYYDKYKKGPKDFRAYRVFDYAEKNLEALRIDKCTWAVIKEYKNYFNTMSHASDLAIYHIADFNQQKGRLGIFYDKGKDEIYRQEFKYRESVLNFIGLKVQDIKDFQNSE